MSFALIIVANHLMTPLAIETDPKTGLDAAVAILIFFVASLAVAAYQALQWGAEADSKQATAVSEDAGD